MKKFIVIGLLLFVVLGVKAQSNNLKLDLFALSGYQIRLNYEYKLSDNKSLMVMGGLVIPHKLAIVDKSTQALEKEFGNSVIAINKFDGYTFGFQARFYTGNKEFPQGFYVTPFIKYHKYGLGLNVLYEDKIDVTQYTDLEDIDQEHASLLEDGYFKYKVNSLINSNIDRYSFGLAVGYQWVIGSGFTVDWTIIGFSVDRINILADVSAQNPYYNPDYTNWSDDIKNKINDFMNKNSGPFKSITKNLETEVTSDNVKFKLPTTIPAPYASLSIGYAF